MADSSDGSRRPVTGAAAIPDGHRQHGALPALADHRRGILWMLLTILLFVSMDTTAKYLAESYPVPQVVWARYVFHVVLVVLLLHRRVPRLLRSGRLALQVLRSLLLVATTGCFFVALSLMPLADASAMMLVAPLVVTGLSVPLLGEPVGIRRWCAVGVGFLGALIILKPGAGLFDWAALLPLLAAALYALYQIATRLLSRSDAPETTILYTGLAGAVVASAIVPWYWKAPDLEGWAVMAVVGTLGGISQFGLIKAFQAAPAAIVSPFGYSNMIWATLFGFVIFGDFPHWTTLAGAVVLIASGLYVWYRERVREGLIH